MLLFILALKKLLYIAFLFIYFYQANGEKQKKTNCPLCIPKLPVLWRKNRDRQHRTVGEKKVAIQRVRVSVSEKGQREREKEDCYRNNLRVQLSAT
uniref:Secreted protein n=1 Tax=Anguilla anguilla TaxID=7936 RepID=A0A0E9QSJ6_ANGAN